MGDGRGKVGKGGRGGTQSASTREAAVINGYRLNSMIGGYRFLVVTDGHRTPVLPISVTEFRYRFPSFIEGLSISGVWGTEDVSGDADEQLGRRG